MATWYLWIGCFLSLSWHTEVPPSVVANGLPTLTVAYLDSLPPTKKGVAHIKSLSTPSKKKRKKTKKASASQQVRVSQTRTNRPAHPSKPKHPRRAPKTDTLPKAEVNAPQPVGSGLSQAEELILLSNVPDIRQPRKIHPSEETNCQFGFDHIDEFTGVQKRGLRPRLLFTYTPEQYRQFIQTSDFIRCEGFLSQSSSGSMALNLDLYVASPVAREKFGPIPPNATLLLRTIDGKEYYFVTYQGAPAKVIDQTTQYQCSFAIPKRDLKNLKEAEIDQVRLRFAEGSQTYDVYYLDFLRDQFPCFE